MKRTERPTQIDLTAALAGAVEGAADWTADPALALALSGALDVPLRPPGTELNDFIDAIVYEHFRDAGFLTLP